jgi:hypothetical protein
MFTVGISTLQRKGAHLAKMFVQVIAGVSALVRSITILTDPRFATRMATHCTEELFNLTAQGLGIDHHRASLKLFDEFAGCGVVQSPNLRSLVSHLGQSDPTSECRMSVRVLHDVPFQNGCFQAVVKEA